MNLNFFVLLFLLLLTSSFEARKLDQGKPEPYDDDKYQAKSKGCYQKTRCKEKVYKKQNSNGKDDESVDEDIGDGSSNCQTVRRCRRTFVRGRGFIRVCGPVRVCD